MNENEESDLDQLLTKEEQELLESVLKHPGMDVVDKVLQTRVVNLEKILLHNVLYESDNGDQEREQLAGRVKECTSVVQFLQSNVDRMTKEEYIQAKNERKEGI